MVEPGSASSADDGSALVVDLAHLSADDVAAVGGKAANLGELIRAGFDVPPGFCVTTEAYRQAVRGTTVEAGTGDGCRGRARGRARCAVPRGGGRGRPRRLRTLGVRRRRARSRCDRRPPRRTCPARASPGSRTPTSMSPASTTCSTPSIAAGRRCGPTGRSPTAPRRASTAPGSHWPWSCSGWWTPQSAGVLFTADPVTGRRRQAVLDAAPGLGEAVVSGTVDPDHFVVDTESERILDRRRGGAADERAASLTDAQVRELVSLGDRVESAFGSPQDIEWAVDADGHAWLTQSRPITTLYPDPGARCAAARRRVPASTSASASRRACTGPSRRWASPPSG